MRDYEDIYPFIGVGLVLVGALVIVYAYTDTFDYYNRYFGYNCRFIHEWIVVRYYS